MGNRNSIKHGTELGRTECGISGYASNYWNMNVSDVFKLSNYIDGTYTGYK